MSKHLADYNQTPIEFVDGHGCFLVGADGKEYLDFLGGWCVGTVGWKNKDMAEAISTQANLGVYIPPWFEYAPQEALAKQLCELAPGNLARVFRCTSGSEAVEFALKAARASTGKPTIVSIDGVYHGHTYGAASVGDACYSNMEPCLPNFIKLPLPKNAADAQRVIAQFEQLARRGDIAAFVSEPVWTNAGCFIPPDGFYPLIENICRANGILLVMDEVATGMGRTGKMFASDWWNIKPDILCLGKALTGGYASLGATLVTEEVYQAARSLPLHSTFGWMPQDLAATAKNVELILQDHLDENAADVGAYLLEELKPLEKLLKVRGVRGIGLVFGIEFHLPMAKYIENKCRELGLIVDEARDNIVFFAPPLCLSKELAKQGADIIKKACGIKV